MSRFVKGFVSLLFFWGVLTTTHGFVLWGPNADWMVERVGFDPAQIGGGPMNIGEEYRWNLPEITYGFSPTFVNYFGQKGIDEVEAALAEFENLPAFETIDPNDYPLKTQRVNHRAQELGLIDLKSFTMSLLMEQFGVGDPQFYIHVLRKRWISPGPTTNYLAIRRNFDPIDYRLTSFINGDLYVWSGLADGDTATVITSSPVDPLVVGGGPVSAIAGAGAFWPGFTRDDIGALKYIYRQSNINVEDLVDGATNATGFGGPIVPAGGQGGSVNTIGGVSGGGSGAPWGTPIFPVATNQQAGGGQGGVPTVNTNLANQGLRQGINDFNFTRLDFDSLIGAFTQQIVNYSDRVQTNELQGAFNQTVSRTLTQPDILFHAEGNAGGATDNVLSFVFLTAPGQKSDTTSHFRFVDALANLALLVNSERDGPGVINPPLVISYSDLGVAWTGTWPSFVSEFTGFPWPFWGTFDGTTNTPIVYPFRSTIEEIEDAVQGRF